MYMASLIFTWNWKIFVWASLSLCFLPPKFEVCPVLNTLSQGSFVRGWCTNLCANWNWTNRRIDGPTYLSLCLPAGQLAEGFIDYHWFHSRFYMSFFIPTVGHRQRLVERDVWNPARTARRGMTNCLIILQWKNIESQCSLIESRK